MVRTIANQNNTQYKRVMGVFKRREDLESALQALKDAGVEKERISLLARHIEDVKGAEEISDGEGNEAKEGAGIGATTGTVLGGIGGFLIGAGVLAIPGVGPVLAAGAGISEIAATLAGAGIGAASGGLVGALVGAGIPEDKAKVYNQRFEAGDYLLMVDGTPDNLRQVASILRDRRAEELGVYDAPDLAQSKQTTPGHSASVGTRDIDSDGEPEVIIVDKRSEATKHQ
ncbi:signal transduction histidine kinase (STHK), LytS [Leptolyngbya sp. CCNP1308]|uniref:signal transduction histidine kinase (STHK), LytS n=1 Tax=Leptolyngbya sp. CCNP1308 TaxID=3110255 RepID=UPI002B1F5F87|nr:signal transduction histidine kinase (STHK), LytS [Leptolyngbya sp. CCNP1308]MEA5447826.1 signal transduction histidine kinase (STHK), LytS [Leptolyngbya sp. CCNP1308]